MPDGTAGESVGPTRAEALARSRWPGVRRRSQDRPSAVDLGLQWANVRWGSMTTDAASPPHSPPIANFGRIDSATGAGARVAVYASAAELLGLRIRRLGRSDGGSASSAT